MQADQENNDNEEEKKEDTPKVSSEIIVLHNLSNDSGRSHTQ